MTAVLDTRMPAGLNADGQTPDEARQFQTQQACRAIQLLMRRIPTQTVICNWSIRRGVHDDTIGIDAQLTPTRNGHAARAAVMALAEQFDLKYDERPSPVYQNSITAVGFYQGVPVRFHDLVEPCLCGCAGVSR